MEVKLIDGKDCLVIPLDIVERLCNKTNLTSSQSEDCQSLPPPPPARVHSPSLQAVQAFCQGANPELWCDGKKTDVKLYVALVEPNDCDSMPLIPANGVFCETIDKVGEDPIGAEFCTPSVFCAQTSASYLWKLCVFTGGSSSFATDSRVELKFHDASVYFKGPWTVERKDDQGQNCLSFSKRFRFDEHNEPFHLTSFSAELNDPAFPSSSSLPASSS